MFLQIVIFFFPLLPFRLRFLSGSVSFREVFPYIDLQARWMSQVFVVCCLQMDQILRCDVLSQMRQGFVM